jgi:hypothetical protein
MGLGCITSCPDASFIRTGEESKPSPPRKPIEFALVLLSRGVQTLLVAAPTLSELIPLAEAEYHRYLEEHPYPCGRALIVRWHEPSREWCRYYEFRTGARDIEKGFWPTDRRTAVA